MTTQTWTSLVRRDTKEPLSTGAIVGIAVGAAALFLASAALFVLYYRRQRRYDAEDSEYYQYANSVQRGQHHMGRTFGPVPRRAPTYTLDYKMDKQGGTGHSTPAQFSADPRTQNPESPPLDDMASAMPTHPAYLPKAVVRGTILKPITRRPSEDNSNPVYCPSTTDSNSMPLQAYRGSSSTATATVTGGSRENDARVTGSKEKQTFPSPPGSGGTGATTFSDDENYYAADPEKDAKGQRNISAALCLASADQEDDEDSHYHEQQQQQSQGYHQQRQPQQPHQPQQSPVALPTPASVASSSSRATRSGLVPTISIPIKNNKKKKFPPPQLNLHQQQHNSSSHNSPNNPNQTTGSGSNLSGGKNSGGLMVDMVMSTSNHRPLSGMEDMSISGPLAFPQYSHQQYHQLQQQQQQQHGGYYVDEYGNPVLAPGSGGGRSKGGRDRSRSFGVDHQGPGHGGESGRREKRHSGNNGRHYEEVEIGRESDIW
ncbi:hypothetical protein GE21DRAFT_7723 [Neurospora crassa]|uniref:Uncharacterized protein n=2 Tax=Neurospora crassa TaxID=5141 RepID=Q1K7W7_NEUCR|nr:hypothetical protein NCU01297 [Neurospora crassa OR74A]EAA32147.1 hypothetical protein NCU01297 [Neurospora crassa OR74A]KHE83517.1 hypothetical protein GE21DRAFT_7723 [Neurospora crassa]CAD70862.1 related to CLOCK protein [Neurospora crassa]|eukprot:XP_961383.1 hypothetical protein NCU01297 [Neurospora crassa OR74A]